MRILLSLLVMALFAGLALPAQAQLPPGSYLRSCRHAHFEDGALVAVCRRVDGFWQRTVLPDVRSCIDGISNDDGQLRCQRAGPPPRYNEFREHRRRCERIEGRIGEVRERLEHTPPSYERERLERRLHELYRAHRENDCR